MIETQEISKVSQGAMTVSEQVKMIRVVDSVTMATANDGFLTIRRMRKEISSVFSPMEEKAKDAKRAADETRKEVMRQWEKVEAPLLAAEAYLNGQMTGYKRIQDDLRAKEQEALRQEAVKVEMARRKAEEEAKLKQAAELEAAGAQEDADAIMAEALEGFERPMAVYTPPPTTQKVELDGMASRTTWKANVVNLKALALAVGTGKAPLNLIEANIPALNRLATALKKEMSIPGVEAISDTRMVPTGR
jgi:hypothetical protein